MISKLLSILILASLSFSAVSASAQGIKKVRKTTVTTTTKEVESDQDDDDATPTPPAAEAPAEVKESVKTATFGSKSTSGIAGCKTEELAKTVVKDLKGDCAAWVKDQKSELKTKFLTSACEEQCDDCSMGLKRCTVTGSVHYTLK